jgi:hypothetical protein
MHCLSFPRAAVPDLAADNVCLWIRSIRAHDHESSPV